MHRISNCSILLMLCLCRCANADGLQPQAPTVVRDLFALSLQELQALKIHSVSLLPESQWRAASSVSQISSTSWERQGSRRLTDAIDALPGTTVIPFRFGANAVAIRGFAGSNLPRGTSLLLDGVPLTGFSNGSALVTLPDISLGVLDTVEQVRGPASSLYGSDAFHGVLSLHTSDPAGGNDTFGSEIGSNGYYQANAQYRKPLGDFGISTGAFSTSGQGDQDIDYAYTSLVDGALRKGGRENASNTTTAFIKYSTPWVNTGSVRGGIYWNSFEGDSFSGAGRSQSPGRSVLAGNDESSSKTDFAMANAAIDMPLDNGMKIELNGFAWESDVNQRSRVPRSDTESGVNEADIVDTRIGFNAVIRQQRSVWNTQWAAALGHDEMSVPRGKLTEETSAGAFILQRPERFEGMKRKIDSVQGEARTGFFDGTLEILYGGRLDYYDTFGTQKMPRTGIIVHPDDDWIVKLLHGKAFRAPTAFELAGIGNFKGNPDLEPETINTTELVLMSMGERWWADLTLFHSTWEDGIVRAPIVDPEFRLQFRNLDESTSRGIESSLHYNDVNWWLDANATYTESRNKTNDHDYSAFPKLILNMGWGYRATRNTTVYLENRALIDQAAETTSSRQRYDALSHYWRTDLNITHLMSARLQAFLNVRNLFDRDNYMPSLFNAEFGIPEESASASIGFRYKFD